MFSPRLPWAIFDRDFRLAVDQPHPTDSNAYQILCSKIAKGDQSKAADLYKKKVAD